MSKIHVLESDGGGNYRIIIHVAVPAGNNSAGVSWKNCVLATRVGGSTSLPVGAGPGEITQTEKDSITSGDVIEISTVIKAESGGATPESLERMVDQEALSYKQELMARLKYYGYTKD